MEVTKNNFESVFPDIVKDIRSATFVCIDGEFTGLHNGLNTMPYDTPEETYLKIRAGSMDFLFIQFGLSIFRRDDKTGLYSNKTYVFYLFPWHRSNLAPDTRFLCQTSSINFLITNNFDFNKLFREGIPYLNSTDEFNFAEAMETRRTYISQVKESPSQPAIPIPKQYQAIVDNAMKKIDKVVKGLEEEVKLEKQTSFVRKLIYQTYEQRYGSPEGVHLQSAFGEMICKRGMENREALDNKELEAAVGFSRVIRELSATGCLIVGHNMLLDLCHLVHRFMDPLPPDYQTFKEMLHTLFPRLVDTKFISSDDSLKDLLGRRPLEGLLETLSQPPFHLPSIEEVDGHSFKGKECQFHNAGYDAFITGKVFLSLVRILDPDNKKSNIINCRPLEKFINKLLLSKSPDGCIDLVNPDPEPDRDHVFHVSFPSSWTATNISKLFSPYGTVLIYWLSDASAWVSLQKKEEGARAQRAFQDTSNLPTGVTLIPYYKYVKEQRKTNSSVQSNKRKATNTEENFISEKKRKNNYNNKLSLIGYSNTSSPPGPEKPPTMKESEIKMLEEAASFSNGGAFDANVSWD